MSPFIESVANVMLDQSSQEWIAGVIVALLLALGLAGAHMLCRRWMKDKVDTASLAGLGIVAIFAGMVIATVSVQLKAKAAAASRGGENARQAGGGGGGGGGFGPRQGGGAGRTATRMATLIFENADADHDGVLSPDEAATAAGKFVAEAGGDGKVKLDREALIAILGERLRPPGAPAAVPAAPREPVAPTAPAAPATPAPTSPSPS